MVGAGSVAGCGGSEGDGASLSTGAENEVWGPAGDAGSTGGIASPGQANGGVGAYPKLLGARSPNMPQAYSEVSKAKNAWNRI